jgi:hypothetical protein
VRAFVLLGIDYDFSKNKMKFLILNPHCQKEISAKELVEQNYVGWQESGFFLRDAFYNFCLPRAKYLKGLNKGIKTAAF